MTQHDRTEERLSEQLHQLAGSSRPTYRDTILERVDRTRQRPAWTFPERWIPMTVIAFPGARQRGVPHTLKLLAVAGLLLAVVAGLVAGAMRLLPPNVLQATLLVPVVTEDSRWLNTSVNNLTMIGGMDDGPGGLLITDVAGDSILAVDGTGGMVMSFGESGRLLGQFEFQRDPMDPQSALGGATWLPDGGIAVADSGNHRVQIIRKVPTETTGRGGTHRQDAWTAVDQIGGFGIEDGLFLDPIDVASSGSELFVVDDQRDDITRFDHGGAFLGFIGEPGEADGQMDFTGGIATDDQGNLYNADYGNGRIQSWDAAQRFRWSVPIPDGGDPDHGQPVDLDVDENGFIWVTTNDGRVLTLAPDGRIVGGWDALAQPGSDVPLVVATSDHGAVFVGEALTGRIHRLWTAQQEVEPLPVPETTQGPTATPGRGLSSPAILRPTVAFPIAFSVTAPSGWSRRAEDAGEVEIIKGTGSDIPARFLASIPFEVYSDPCHPEAGVVPMGTSARDLAMAIANGEGMEAGSFEETSIDGHPSVVFDLVNRIDLRTCSDPSAAVRQWRNVTSGGGPGFAQRTGPGARQRIAVVDVDGTRVVFWTETFMGPIEAIREAQEVLDGLRIP